MSYDDFRRPSRAADPQPKRIVGRKAYPARPGGLADPQFDEFFAEARQMQKEMIKSVPTAFKVAWLFSVVLGLAFLGLISWAIVALVLHFT